ncbi:MAG: PKD domain-containing protein [Algoriphagus sp.]|uniref:PKD domain-containing protein n=1 Tax=Algoriphagus sp. TaxID=1872435 RepID=UPI0017A9AF26|nr:PKD domain-containing protein [Algoriphagus sp.]NVJ86761.1 PKD domain-containing protein [Algoriphagus sp.]
MTITGLIKILSHKFLLKSFALQRPIRYIFMFFLIFLTLAESFSQEIITVREGFPYCESFETLNPRANTVINGTKRVGKIDVPFDPVLTGSSLQLTSNNSEENGYVYIDYPFASNRGVKVSFEYSSFGKTTSEGADGLSFFMFDGSIDPSNFEIGGKGGALGYTARRAVNGGVEEENEPGLKGAYLGIGLDEFGNFGNYYENKRYGFLGRNTVPISSLNSPGSALDRFPHSIVLRGPVMDSDVNRNDAIAFASYEFITGRILNENVFLGVDAEYLSPFGETLFNVDINSDEPVFDCNDIGYRKVFIDLQPDPVSGFKVNVWMLINETGTRELIHVIVDEPYPYTAPPFLKIGFSASTGGSNNFHNIKNVTVEVSDLTGVNDPTGSPYLEEVCQGGELEFEINPQVDNEAFVRCIQLFEDLESANEAKTAAETASSDQSFDCGLSGTCFYELCKQENLKIDTNFGYFETFMEEVSDGTFIQKIRFASNGILSNTGQVTVYYTVVDNFGQMSDPQPITVEVVPNPDPIITTIDPLVWEQSEINDVRVLFDAEPKGTGYIYQWYKDGTPISGATSDSYLAIGPSAIGDYTVEVTTGLGCFGVSNEEVKIRIVEDLNPQIPTSGAIRETCDQLGSIQVILDGDEISGIDDQGNQGNEKYRIVSLPGNAVIVDWTFLTPGQSVIEEANLTAGSYIFQIGDQYRSGQPGSDGSPLFRHEIPFEILPIEFPLLIDAIPENPLCFQGQDGSITVNAQDGNGTYTYELIQGGSVISKSADNISETSFTFSSLPAGNYEVRVESGSRCEEYVPIELIDPSPVELTVSEVKDVTCVENDGLIEWIATGGSGIYSFVSLSRDGNILDESEFTLLQDENVFTTSGLTSGTYTLIVSDDQGCTVFEDKNQLIEVSPKPSLDLQSPEEICEGDDLYIEASLLESGELENPVYTWVTPDGDRINSNTEIDGVSYELIDHDNDSFTPSHLIVRGFRSGNYTFSLELSGPYSCDLSISTNVEVLPLPQTIFNTISTSCFNSSDGEITLESVDPSSNYIFTIKETGQSNTTGDFSGLPAGQYTIRVQEDGGLCFSEEIVEITQPNELQILNEDLIHPTCGDQNGSFSFDLVGGTKDYSILINSQAITDYSYTIDGDRVEVFDLPPGNYSVDVTDANSCSISISNLVNLVNDDGYEVVLNPMVQEVCLDMEVVFSPTFTNSLPVKPTLRWYKDFNLTDPITNLNDPNGLSFSINDVTGELIVKGLPEGNHEFFLEITGPGICPVIKTAEAIVYLPISAEVEITPITCIGDTNGSIKVLPSGGNGQFEISFDGGSFGTISSYSSLPAGEYTIAIRNNLGCVLSQNVTIESPSSPISINEPTIIRASCGLPNGSIQDLEISGGWSNYSVEWRKGSLNGAVLQGSQTDLFDLFPDTYFLIVTDGEGCEEIFEFEIEESSDPVYQVVPPIDVCVGNTVSIRPIHIAPDPNLPPAAATEVRWYKNANQNGLIGNGPDLDNPSIIYSIDDSDWLNPKLEITGLPAGKYSYYFYVVCTGQEIEIEVEVFDVPDIILETSPVTCFGDSNGSLKIIGGDLPRYTYSVNGAEILEKDDLESMSFSAGTYELEIFTPAGCSQKIDFEILGPSAPLDSSLLQGINPGCGSSNGKLFAEIIGGWKPYQIEVIKDGSIFQTLSSQDGIISLEGLELGEYSLTISDKEGCTISTNLVELINGPTQILVEKIEICSDGTAILIPELDPPASGVTFQWYFDDNLTQEISSSSNPAPDGKIYQINPSSGELIVSGFSDNEQEYNYFVTVSGPTICPGFVGKGEIQVFEIPSATISVNDEVCFGTGGSIELNPTGGSGILSYSLNGGPFVSSTSFNVPTGIHTIEIQSSVGCNLIIPNIEVNGPNSALEVFNQELVNPTCELNNGIIRFEIEGGYAPYNVYYSRIGDQEQSLFVNQPGLTEISGIGQGIYQLRIEDSQGCELFISNELDIQEAPTEIFLSDKVICEGELAILTPSVSQNITDEVFTWYYDENGNQPIINNSSVDGVTYQVSDSGELTIGGLNGNGSPYTYFVMVQGTGICGVKPTPAKVTVNSIPNLRVSNPSVVCDPAGTVDLTNYIEGFNPNVYEYNILSPSGIAMQISELDAVNISGDYRVSSSLKGTGCWNEPQRILVIIADELLEAKFDYQFDLGDGNLISNDTIQIFEEIQFTDLSSGKVILWSWDFGDGSVSSEPNPLHFYQEKGSYTIQLQVIDEFGCISVFEQLIQVSDDYWVRFPNAFTPSRIDGKNNYFKPVFRGIASMEFYVFTTWGELVYQSNSLDSQGWDGKFKGVEAPNGNYIYRGKFISNSGEVLNESGVFTLIR